MEYIRLGNLEAQHKVSPMSNTEMMVIFTQCLEALSHLHGHNIAHRDLKPENILFCCRTPPHIKLADFGLAQDRLDLKTFCGSPKYAAPEIFLGQPYTNGVDIWSLAVIMMEFMYGLCQYEEPGNLGSRKEFQLWGQAWCRFLITAADDWDSDKVIDFIIEYMLRWEPHERLPAAECSKTASIMGLFDGAFSKTGQLTPKLQPTKGATDVDTEEEWIVMGPLWQDVRPSLRDDGQAFRSQSGNKAPEFGEMVNRLDRPSSLHPSLDTIGLQPKTNTPQLQNTSPSFVPDADSMELIETCESLGSYRTPRQRSHLRNLLSVPQLSTNSVVEDTPGLFLDDGIDNGDVCPEIGLSDRNGCLQVPRPPLTPSQLLSFSGQEGSENLPGVLLHQISYPPLPHLSINSIGNLHAIQSGDSLRSQIYRCGNDQGNSNVESLLHGPDDMQDPRHEESSLSASKAYCKRTSKRKRSMLLYSSSKIPDPSPEATKKKVGKAAISSPALDLKVNDPPGYVTEVVDGKPVSMRQEDLWLNATQIVNLARKTINQRAVLLRNIAQTTEVKVCVFNGNRSSWVPFGVGANLCRQLDLTQTLRPLLEYGKNQGEQCSQIATSEHYFQVETGRDIIYVRKADFRINAAHLRKASGLTRHELAKIRKALRPDQYTIVRGRAQGTYVDAPIAIEWCRERGLDPLQNVIEATLKEHGYQDVRTQQSGQRLPPINTLRSVDPPQPLIPTSSLFPEVGSSSPLELDHPNPSPQELVWESRSQLCAVNSFFIPTRLD